MPWRHDPGSIRMTAAAVVLTVAAAVVLAPVQVKMPLIVPVTGWGLTAAWAWGAIRRLRAAHAARSPIWVAESMTAWQAIHCGRGFELIGDAERAVVADLLGERLATGHLTLAEFHVRHDQAFKARRRSDLILPLDGLTY